jgi:DNA-binding NtrC family response regulator
MTAYGEVQDAVGALRDGARDYLTKPFADDELLLRVQRIAERQALHDEITEARALVKRVQDRGVIIGRSAPMTRMKALIEAMAPSDASILVLGESGTGKELIARQLHTLSDRADGPFVAVHCAAFPETLIEAELFGHERGAFTGAIRQRDGRFKIADGGTLFLDEIAEIPLPAQAKLLRVLQEGTFTPIGSNTPIRVDVRIVSATHRDLKAQIAAGQFREDLYYRLNVLDILAPPLRERAGDLPLLVEYFLNRFAKEKHPDLSPEAWAALMNHPFPGNVRELEHAMQHAVVLSRGQTIELAHLPRDISKEAYGLTDKAAMFKPLADAHRAFERTYVLQALRLAEGRRTQAAELLGISRKNLWEKMKTHSIADADIQG